MNKYKIAACIETINKNGQICTFCIGDKVLCYTKERQVFIGEIEEFGLTDKDNENSRAVAIKDIYNTFLPEHDIKSVGIRVDNILHMTKIDEDNKDFQNIIKYLQNNKR